MRSTRAVDSTSVDSILPIEETEESARLHETLRQHSIQSVSALASYGEEDDIAEVYGISSWVDSLPEKKISIGTLANYYTIIGL